MKASDVKAGNLTCLENSDPDEPTFLLVGRDMLAADSIRDWADRLERAARQRGELDAARKAKIADARRTAIAMDKWPTKKLPD